MPTVWASIQLCCARRVLLCVSHHTGDSADQAVGVQVTESRLASG